MTLIAAVGAVLVGLTLGLLGGGGAIVTVPVLVYALGLDAKLAVVMALPIVGGVSLIGVVQHWRQGNVDFRTAGAFGLTAMGGAYGGARLAQFVSGRLQLTLLALLMLGSAFSMLRGAGPKAAAESDTRNLSVGVLAVGLGVGVLTGLLGIGGGFLLVPALVLLAQVPMRQAVGTSLTVIAMNTAAGYLGYLGQVDLPWTLVLQFSAIAGVGIIIGSALVPRIPQLALKKSFGVLLIFLGALILWQQT
ncbi:sulfite exporter TauE/SafE family protein [Pseudogemmatithrix spongiicola]|uniref:Probable membrane transporter protein n=1 Tax=Pseudogemmatithrix spongiicola TaxID=3062599 RepID=A0AA49JXY0_9BACT|nr:sulfite exporter TauE/SafE family protein [Gemmatimonadaceae bacterium 'strain 138']WKW13847.1 sulfite exporter TauE/SafE family protein [Gemmatimonadaceae bacterium 'strain 318']